VLGGHVNCGAKLTNALFESDWRDPVDEALSWIDRHLALHRPILVNANSRQITGETHSRNLASVRVELTFHTESNLVQLGGSAQWYVLVENPRLRVKCAEARPSFQTHARGESEFFAFHLFGGTPLSVILGMTMAVQLQGRPFNLDHANAAAQQGTFQATKN